MGCQEFFHDVLSFRRPFSGAGYAMKQARLSKRTTGLDIVENRNVALLTG
jgi:hypothetical protein